MSSNKLVSKNSELPWLEEEKKKPTGLISHGPIFEITSALFFFSLNEDQYMQKLEEEEDEFMCVCVCVG